MGDECNPVQWLLVRHWKCEASVKSEDDIV